MGQHRHQPVVEAPQVAVREHLETLQPQQRLGHARRGARHLLPAASVAAFGPTGGEDRANCDCTTMSGDNMPAGGGVGAVTAAATLPSCAAAQQQRQPG